MNTPLKRGMVLRHQNHLFIVSDFHERHTGRGRPNVHVALRDLIDGHQVDRTLDELTPVVEAEYTYRQVQYLYHHGDDYIFMDSETFEELKLPKTLIGSFTPFMLEGEAYRVMFVEGRPVRFDAPDTALLHVSLTAAPSHGGVGTSVQKEAELENGLKLQVPLFIKTGDLIRVNTRDGTYSGKEKE